MNNFFINLSKFFFSDSFLSTFFKEFIVNHIRQYSSPFSETSFFSLLMTLTFYKQSTHQSNSSLPVWRSARGQCLLFHVLIRYHQYLRVYCITRVREWAYTWKHWSLIPNIHFQVTICHRIVLISDRNSSLPSLKVARWKKPPPVAFEGFFFAR